MFQEGEDENNDLFIFFEAPPIFFHQTQHIGFYLTTIFWDYIISIAQVVARLEHLVELADRVETKRRLEAVVVFFWGRTRREQDISDKGG